MKPQERTALPRATRSAVLTEAGYRCAVPTCRQILALDIHHIWEVSAGGGDDLSNLVALCPTCHVLYHRGTILTDSIYAYKSMLIAISRAFDIDAIDRLLFLHQLEHDTLVITGDGVLGFARLIAAGLANFEQKANNNWQIVTYTINISGRGKQIIDAWKVGDRSKLKEVMSGPIPNANVDETAV